MTAGPPDSMPRPDITSRTDIAGLLTAFYARAFSDDLLGPVFVDIARMDLAAHLPVMCDFWETVLFRAGLYRRNALHVHRDLDARTPLTAVHFARWLDLWITTTDKRHAGPVAELAKLQAGRIAGSMSRRLSGRQPKQPDMQRPVQHGCAARDLNPQPAD